MSGGATLLVEAVRRISHIESTQTKLGLTIVGFATGFELVVLAWSASRRGMSEAVVAGVVGSFAYNVTMTLGAAALAHPLVLQDVHQLHVPLLAMLVSLVLIDLRRHTAKGFDPCAYHCPCLRLWSFCFPCRASLNFRFSGAIQLSRTGPVTQSSTVE